MSSSASPAPSEHLPTPAPLPPQPAASGSQASLSSPPKPNPPIITAPSRRASGATTTAPSRNASGATTIAAPSRNLSGTTSASAAASRKGVTSTTAAVSRSPSAAITATATATAVSRNPSVAAAAAASRNPLWAATTAAATGSGAPRTAPTRPEDYTPRMGLEFESEHEAYEFYRYYGWMVGFNVRKEYANKSKKTGEITSRKFACSREGYRANVKRGNHMLVPMPDSRTGCEAWCQVGGLCLPAAGHNHPLFAISCMPNPFQLTTLPDVVPPPDFFGQWE